MQNPPRLRSRPPYLRPSFGTLLAFAGVLSVGCGGTSSGGNPDGNRPDTAQSEASTNPMDGSGGGPEASTGDANPPTDTMMVGQDGPPVQETGPMPDGMGGGGDAMVVEDAVATDTRPDTGMMMGSCTGGPMTITCGMGECRRTVQACVNGVPNMCTPGSGSMETCDGLDNDCNGMVDDGLGNTTCGVGACQRMVNNCEMGMSLTCTPGRPQPETCDGIDNDCNGMIDDGLGSSTCGVGACQQTVQNCMGGRPQTCMPGAPAIETCNGRDDDCDGTADNGLGNTTCGVGACMVTQPICSGGMVRECMPRAPSPEICNGRDDDCNGAVDDDPSLVNPVTCGIGECQRMVVPCQMGTPRACTAGNPVAEICDGLDNDCDGTPDDGNPGGGGMCTTMYNMNSRCFAGTRRCMGGMLVCEPNVMPGAMMEICNNIDDDCDGAVDNGISCTCTPGMTRSCGTDTGECTTGTQTCMMTGSGSMWGTCVGGVQPATETCNGRDDDCNGTVDNNPPSGPICAVPNATVTATACQTSTCRISTCAANRFDVNGTYSDGCECLNAGGLPACSPSVQSLGTINNGGTGSVSGNIPQMGGEDWYQVSFPYNNFPRERGAGTPTIQLTAGASEFAFTLYSSCGSGSGGTVINTCPGATTWWRFTDNAGGDNSGTNYSTRNTAWPSSVYIRVVRQGTAPVSCNSYTISVSRP